MSNKFEQEVHILKIEEEERKVWGIFSAASVNGESLVDKQGDVIETQELEKAAHNFMLNSRTAGREHNEMGVGQLIESIVLTKEKASALEGVLKEIGAEDPVIRPNADVWFGAFHIDSDETWELIKSEEFTSFSIGGRADKEKMK